jgi:hypothetical protein
MAGLCIPDSIIWPDPSVLPVDPGGSATDDELAAYAIAQQQVAIATEMAWSTLQTLSGFALALCTTTVRPCRQAYTPAWWLNPLTPIPPFFPQVRDGIWTNIWCGCGYDNCGCTTSKVVTLPGPVVEIVEVVVDGDTVDPADYRVDDNLHLVRDDGDGWPLSQNYGLPAGEVGTWSVEYWRGTKPDVMVNYAAGILADEYLKAMTGQDCRLPSGTTSVVRLGVTIEMTPDWFQNSRTGIPEVDVVIASLNPFGTRGRAVMFNPDRKPARETTYRSGS